MESINSIFLFPAYIKSWCILPDLQVYHYAEVHLSLYLGSIVKVSP